MNTHYQKTRKEAGTFITVLKKYLMCVVIFALLSLIFTVITGIIFFGFDDPTSKINMASYISLFLSSFLSAFLLSKKFVDKNALHGFIFGLILVVITLIVSIFVDNGKGTFENAISKALTVIICVFSAILGHPRQKRKRKFKI